MLVDSYFHKRKKFEFESEFRVLYQYFPANSNDIRTRKIIQASLNIPGSSISIESESCNFDVETKSGVRIPLNMENFIETVIISPSSNKLFNSWVKSLISEIDKNIVILPSSCRGRQ